LIRKSTTRLYGKSLLQFRVACLKADLGVKLFYAGQQKWRRMATWVVRQTAWEFLILEIIY